MKVYFTASAATLDELGEYYGEMISTLEKMGHEVLMEYDPREITMEIIESAEPEKHVDIYQAWKDEIREADVAVVEMSFPGTINLGSCIAGLVERGKPTLGVYYKGKQSVFTEEIFSSRLVRAEYDKNNIEAVLQWGLEELESQLQRRFTMLIPGEIDSFLDKVVREEGVSRSEFIRDLILEKMGEK